MEKINIAELLRNCPQGMELDCTMYEDVYFDNISDCENFIYCYINYEDRKTYICFNKYGSYTILDKSKCVIFPKGKTTWEGFVPPCKFKDGDIIYNPGIKAVAIFCKQTDDSTISHCFLNKQKELKIRHYHSKFLSDWMLATEEEKAKLFQAIKDDGYRWNEETKTLEKLNTPRFKVGDRIKSIHNVFQYDIKELNDTHYTLVEVEDKFKYTAPIIEDKNWELAPNKFDINTLVPFESRVLVRNTEEDIWKPAIFGCYPKDKSAPYYALGGICWRYCIPYGGNEHLLGTTDDCDDFYKIWVE